MTWVANVPESVPQLVGVTHKGLVPNLATIAADMIDMKVASRPASLLETSYIRTAALVLNLNLNNLQVAGMGSSMLARME